MHRSRTTSNQVEGRSSLFLASAPHADHLGGMQDNCTGDEDAGPASVESIFFGDALSPECQEVAGQLSEKLSHKFFPTGDHKHELMLDNLRSPSSIGSTSTSCMSEAANVDLNDSDFPHQSSPGQSKEPSCPSFAQRLNGKRKLKHWMRRLRRMEDISVG